MIVGVEEAISSNQHQDAFEEGFGSCERTKSGEDLVVSTTSNRSNVSGYNLAISNRSKLTLIPCVFYALTNNLRATQLTGVEEANSSNQHLDVFESGSGSCELTNSCEEFVVSTTSNWNNVSGCNLANSNRSKLTLIPCFFSALTNKLRAKQLTKIKLHEKMDCHIRTGHEIFSEVWKVVENNAPLEIWMTTMMSLFKPRSTS